jgi:hypothetical protein
MAGATIPNAGVSPSALFQLNGVMPAVCMEHKPGAKIARVIKTRIESFDGSKGQSL